ncbi:MAG: hypothetical protein ACYTGV_02185 [Planctomycetota bacterium]|jgi:hypothetical protein
MTIRILLTLTLVAALSAAAFAQDCGGCPSPCEKKQVKQCSESAKLLSEKVSALEASAAKGCETSGKKLVALRKACGVETTAALKEKVAAFEKSAACGCAESAKSISDLQAVLARRGADKGPVLSKRIDPLVASAKGGCKVSKAKVAALLKFSEVKCCKDLAKTVAALEASKEQGCEKSAARLTFLELCVAPLSERVQTFCVYSEKGCEVSKATIDALLAKADVESPGELSGSIRKLEVCAEKGCKKSGAKLVALELQLPGAAEAAERKGCGADCDGDSEKCGSDGG